MPELPEVETIRRSLEKLILGKQVQSLECFTPEVLENPHNFVMDGSGEYQIKELARKGKYLRILFEESEILVHLRMTGKLIYKSAEEFSEDGYGPYCRALFRFSDHSALIFDDIRRFGRIKCLRDPEEDKGYAGLGKDALFLEDSDYPSFNDELNRHKKANIKSNLLNQSVLAGLGNIYCDEVLFRAGIRPSTRTERISQKRRKLLFSHIRPLLEEAIGLGGSSFRDYVDGLGKKGNFQLTLAVYQQNGKPCKICNTPIEKRTLNGRGTHFCPHCQK